MTHARTAALHAAAVRRRLALSSALSMSLAAFAVPAAAQVNVVDGGTTVPGVGNFQDGAVVVSPGGTAGSTTQVNVTSARAVVNWERFNVPQNATANFINQSSAQTAVVLNRVTTIAAGNTTTLGGTINGVNSRIAAAGLLPQGRGVEVWVSNPNGIIMGATGNFNTQGFVATTLRFDGTDVDNFLDGGEPLTLTAPLASEIGITGAAGQIVTNGRVQAFIAPVIRLTGGTHNAGAGSVGFVVASDVTIANPGSPLSLTINAGTSLDRADGTALLAGGDVTAQTAYYVVGAQAATNALLSIPASASTATTTDGVVVLGGAEFGLTFPTDIASNAATSGRVDVEIAGSLGASGGGATLTGDRMTIYANGTIDVTGRLNAGAAFIDTAANGAIDVSGSMRSTGLVSVNSIGGSATVTGGVSAARYSVLGRSVTLGTDGTALPGAGSVAQAAAGAVTLRAGSGALTIDGDLRLSGGSIAVGGQGTTALSLTNSTLDAGTGTVTFQTATTASPFGIGNVVAGTLNEVRGANPAASIDRTGAVSFGDVRLSNVNTIATTGALTIAGDLTLGGGGTTTLAGGGGVTIGGAIGNIAGQTTNLTINGGASTTTRISLQNSTLTGTLTATAGSGGLTFTNLGGTGAKTLTASGAINGTSIDGGGVTLAGTGSKTITAGIGQTSPVASLAVTGSVVTIGTAGAANPRAVAATGAVQLGTAANPLTALTVNGSTVAGSVAVTAASATMGDVTANDAMGAVDINTANTQSLGVVRSSGTATLRANTDNGLSGDARFTSVTAAGDVVISGVAVGGTASGTGQSDVTSTGGSVTVGYAGSDAAGGRTRLGTVTAGSGVAITTGAFDVATRAIANNGNAVLTSTAGAVLSSGGSATNGSFTVSATGGAARVSGGVTATGDFSVTGTSVTLGNGSAVTQTAGGRTAIVATGGAGTAGAITGLAGLSLVADDDAAGGEQLAIGGSATGDIGFAGATLRAGDGGTGVLAIATANGTDLLSLGNVVAGTITQQIGTDPVGALDRVGAITFSSLTLSGTGNAISSDGLLTTGAVTLSGGGAKTLALTGDGGVTTGALTDAGATDGTITISTTGGNGVARVAGSDLRGTLTINAGSGGAVLGTLAGAGAKVVTSGGSIRGAGTGGAGFATLGAGAVDLTAASNGTITLNGVSATGVAAASLTINGAAQATINGAVNTGGAVSIGQGTATGALTVTGPLASGSLTASTTNGIRLASATTAIGGITLTAGSSIAADALGAAAGLTLAGVGDGITTVEVGTLRADGDAVLGTAGLRLASIALTGPSSTGGGFSSFTTGSTALGSLSVPGTLTASAAAGDVTFATLGGTGTKTIAAGGSIDGDAIGGTGAVDLGAGSAGTITVDAITGPVASLTVNGGSSATFFGPVAVVGATSIGQGGGGATTGAVRFTGALTTGSLDSRTAGDASFAAVTTAADATGTIRVRSTGDGAITFSGAVNGGGALVTDTGGTTRFGGAVGDVTPLASLATRGTGGVAIDGGSIRTAGTQSYGGAVTLGAATVLSGTDGSFAAGVNGGAGFNDLTLRFSGDSALAADPFTGVGNLLVDGGGTTTLAGVVRTRGAQRWVDAVVLAGATTLQSDGGGAITLARLSGANALTVNTAGTTTFGEGASGLAAITTDAPGTTILNGTLTTSGVQAYNDAVRLGSATLVTASAASFAGTVDGAQALTVTAAGNTVFGGVVGGTDALASLTVDGGGTTTVNGGAVTTSGVQTYADRLSLGADTVLTGAGASFAGGVAGNGRALILNFGGSTDIGGGFVGVGDLDVIGTASLGGTINTSGGQRYRSAVTLAGATTLQSGGGTGTGAISFDGTVNGAQALVVTTAGATSFNAPVGNTAPLASLEVGGTGPIVFAAGIPADSSTVATSGQQRYAGAVTLAADARFTTAGGAVGFGGTVDGAHLLSVATGGAGGASFAGRLGGATALTGLAIDARTATFGATGNRVGTIAAAVRGGGLNYDDAAQLSVGQVDGLSGISTNGAIGLTAAGIVQTAGAAIDAGAGTITLDGNDGAIVLGGSLTTTDATPGAVRIVDASSLTLGPVAAATGTVTLGGSGGDAITGTITQRAGTTIVAAGLAGNAGGSVTLTNADNAVTTLGAFAAGGFSLRERDGLTVAGPVDAGTGDLTLIVDSGALALAGPLTASVGTVTLDVGGAITQNPAAGGGIVAARLTGRSVGGATLRSPGNAIATLAGFTNSGTGGLDLVNGRALAIAADIDGGQTLAIAADGIDFTGRTLRAATTVGLDGRAGSVVGAAAIAGTDLSIAGADVDLGSATAGNGAAGVLSVTTGTGPLRLGTGFAGQRATLRAGGDLSVTGSLSAGTAGNTASISVIDAVAAGAASIALATSNNGGASITGGSVGVGRAVATNGALALRAADGALTLGSGRASGNVTVDARGTGGSVEVQGLLEAGGTVNVTGTGAVGLAGVEAAGATALRSTTGNVTFASLVGAGAKSVTAAGAITGGSIAGAGAVTLTGGTTGAITVATIGAASPVAALTVEGGSLVTLGSGGTINVAGATRIGQVPGAGTGALVVDGALSTGTLTTTTTGATTFGSLALNATGNGVTAGGRLTTGTVTLAGGGVRSLVLTGDGGVFTGAIGNVAGTTGTVTVDADAGAGEARVASADLAGTLTITGGTAGATFGTLTGAGDKLVASTGGIRGIGAGGTGAVIDGGAVTLRAGSGAIAANMVQVDAIGTATPVTSLAIDGGAGVTIGRSGNTGAAIVANGRAAIGQATPVGSLTVNGTASAASFLANGTGATVLTGGVTATGGAIGLGAGSLQATTLTATGAVSVAIGGDATLVGGTSGGDFGVTAGGAARIAGTVAAGGAYRVRAASASLGTGTTAQSARGQIDIVTTAGALTGSNGLTLTSNADGVGSDYLAIDTTGTIDLGGTALVGGTAADASDISVVQRAAGAAVTLGTVTGRQLGGFNAARTAIGTLAADGAVTITGPAVLQRGLSIASTGGAITVDEVRVTDAGQGIALTTTAPTGGAITARLLSANTSGAIGIDARGVARVGTAGGGATSVRGSSASIGTATVRGALALTATAGSATLGTGDVVAGATVSATGGDVEVTTRLTAGGATTIGASGAARLAQVVATAGDLAVTAGGAISGTGNGRAALSATGAGANLRIQAGGVALLGTVQAANGVTVQGATIDATAATATAGALSLTATGGNLLLGAGTAGSSALLDAAGTASLGPVTAGSGSSITVRALDAALSGTLRAGEVAFVNRAPTTTALRLGTGTSAGGFQLSATEVNLVDANTLAFDGGSGNVEVGALAFGTNAGRTGVDVLSTGRIDVTGTVTGAGAGRTFRFGGTAASTDAKANVIAVVATPAGGGGLLFDTANLDLRGARIGVGQAPGFLDALGLGAGGNGGSATGVGELFVGNANSALYNPALGGQLYNPTGTTLVSANSLTVRYTDYALFQNTAAPGSNAGVALGSASSPVSNALVLQGPGTGGNSFALFGTINGFAGSPAAVVGPTVVSVNNVALAATRINGCIVGSGAGCLTAVVSQPVLNVFDASRLDVFRTADDLALPFDPVIGTNNEALFSGITLDDVPVTSTPCTDGGDGGQCRRGGDQNAGEPK